MSANKDKDQRVTFLFSNLYKAQKQREADAEAKGIAIPTQTSESSIVKVGDLKTGVISKQMNITAYQPTELLGKKIELARNKESLLNPAPKTVTPSRSQANEALEGLKENLRSLNELHSRLKFMLTELEDLTKK